MSSNLGPTKFNQQAIQIWKEEGKDLIFYPANATDKKDEVRDLIKGILETEDSSTIDDATFKAVEEMLFPPKSEKGHVKKATYFKNVLSNLDKIEKLSPECQERIRANLEHLRYLRNYKEVINFVDLFGFFRKIWDVVKQLFRGHGLQTKANWEKEQIEKFDEFFKEKHLTKAKDTSIDPSLVTTHLNTRQKPNDEPLAFLKDLELDEESPLIKKMGMDNFYELSQNGYEMYPSFLYISLSHWLNVNLQTPNEKEQIKKIVPNQKELIDNRIEEIKKVVPDLEVRLKRLNYPSNITLEDILDSWDEYSPLPFKLMMDDEVATLKMEQFEDYKTFPPKKLQEIFGSRIQEIAKKSPRVVDCSKKEREDLLLVDIPKLSIKNLKKIDDQWFYKLPVSMYGFLSEEIIPKLDMKDIPPYATYGLWSNANNVKLLSTTQIENSILKIKYLKDFKDWNVFKSLSENQVLSLDFNKIFNFVTKDDKTNKKTFEGIFSINDEERVQKIIPNLSIATIKILEPFFSTIHRQALTNSQVNDLLKDDAFKLNKSAFLSIYPLHLAATASRLKAIDSVNLKKVSGYFEYQHWGHLSDEQVLGIVNDNGFEITHTNFAWILEKNTERASNVLSQLTPENIKRVYKHFDNYHWNKLTNYQLNNLLNNNDVEITKDLFIKMFYIYNDNIENQLKNLSTKNIVKIYPHFSDSHWKLLTDDQISSLFGDANFQMTAHIFDLIFRKNDHYGHVRNSCIKYILVKDIVLVKDKIKFFGENLSSDQKAKLLAEKDFYLTEHEFKEMFAVHNQDLLEKTGQSLKKLPHDSIKKICTHFIDKHWIQLTKEQVMEVLKDTSITINQQMFNRIFNSNIHKQSYLDELTDEERKRFQYFK